MKFLRNSLILLACAGFLAPLSADDTDLPETLEDGLVLVEGSKLAAVYAEPGADLGEYNRVNVLDAKVAFRKDWLKDQRAATASSRSANRVSSRDVERIKTNLAELFAEEFNNALTEAGYETTDEVADDVLTIAPAIINLDVANPDTRATTFGRSYQKTAGQMTLYVELYDSVTGDLIAKAVDLASDRHQNFYSWSNATTNETAARGVVQGWAGVLVNALDEAHGKSE